MSTSETAVTETPRADDWDEPEKPDGSGAGWMKLIDGENLLGIRSKPRFAIRHYTPFNTEPFVSSATCAGDGQCFLDDCGVPKRKEAFFAVLDRNDNSAAKILNLPVSHSVYEGLYEIARDDEYPDILTTNVKVKREKKGKKTTYQVLPGTKVHALTDEEKPLVDAVVEAIDRVIQPVDPQTNADFYAQLQTEAQAWAEAHKTAATASSGNDF
jgi:hypothetical protein